MEMLPDKNIKCPYTAFKMKCFDGVTKHNCPKWVQIQGKNPQTGEDMNQCGCADSFLPLIMIENSQMQHQTARAIEDFRNKMVALNTPNLNSYLPDIEKIR
jgi:hypothetical protein